MMRRDIMVRGSANRRRPTPSLPVLLGPLSELRRTLPFVVELDGEEFRVVEHRDGTLLAHATTCPHWLGPLGAAAEDGIVRCPCADIKWFNLWSRSRSMGLGSIRI